VLRVLRVLREKKILARGAKTSQPGAKKLPARSGPATTVAPEKTGAGGIRTPVPLRPAHRVNERFRSFDLA